MGVNVTPKGSQMDVKGVRIIDSFSLALFV